MDQLTFRRNASTTHSSFSSRLARTLPFRRQSTNQINIETADEIRGQYGLVLLSSPSEPVVDFVFVHGLRGGSRKTWSKSADPLHFWPKEWLSRDPDFRHVRIHSFGYNSDWSDSNDNVLNIHDFGKSLLSALHDSSLIRRDATLPIVMIGHSMGGLVIKKAYILAKRDPTYHDISHRFHTVFFIATPHRGADSAQLLSNLLRAASLGNHAYLVDLRRNSVSIESINDEFRHIHDRLSLYSFYETVPTNLGIKNSLIVEKDSAILGYAGERTAYINADHRGVCKFETPDSPNYLILRNAFVHTIDGIFENWAKSRAEIQREQKQRLESFLGVHQTPEDQYLHHSDLKIHGTCDWLLEKQSFQDWRDADSSSVYWLSANPASGKSVLSAHVIKHLEDTNLTCSYFFFTRDSKVDSKLSHCLRSTAYQMALSNVYVRDALLAMIDAGSQLAKGDFRAIWRKVFVGVIFRTPLFQPYFWVLDGVDECEDRHELVKKLGEIEHDYPLRVFLTSRPSAVSLQFSGHEDVRMHVEQLSAQESANDIRALIEANMHHFPAENDIARGELIQRIMTKSNGCFLWVKLMVDELRDVYAPRDINKILDGVPTGMDALYSRIVKNMENAQYGKEVAKAILTWTVLSARPLTVDELNAALQLDIEDTIHDLAGKAASICGHLVYVDSKSRVRMIHQTAREFLLDPSLQSEFALKEAECQSRLANICLSYLLGNEMKAPRGRRSSATRIALPGQSSPFAHYVCGWFYEHVRQTSSAEEEIFKLLHSFLTSSNVLRWIEIVAQSGDIDHLVRTGKIVDDFLRRRTRKGLSSKEDLSRTVKAWSIDLVRLASKFGQQLLMVPGSVYNLVAPFCPPDSAMYKQFGTSTRSITVGGLSARSWDDRVSCHVAPGEQVSSAAYSDAHYAVGYSSGLVTVFQTTSCQAVRKMFHGELIKSLQFSHSGRMLASGGMSSVQVFNAHNGDRILNLSTGHQCLALRFDSRDQSVSAALRNSEKMTWKLDTGNPVSSTKLVDEPGHMGQQSMATRAPVGAAFSPELNLLALVFRAPAIMLWDLETDSFDGYCDRCPEGDSESLRKVRPAPALNVVFCSIPTSPLLAATYFDGELVLFDPDQNTIIATTMAGGEVLASSPDGRFVATGDSAGNIQLFECQTLKLVYRVNSWDHGIRALAFSDDGRRFVDIRGSTCNVWEPSELIRQESADQNSDSDARSYTAKEIDLADDDDLVMITACVIQPAGKFVICGKDDGSVCLYDARTGLQIHILYDHGQGAAVTHLTCDRQSGLIASADDSSMVLVHRMSNKTVPDVGDPMLRIKLDHAINQLQIASQRLFIISLSAASIFNIDAGQLIKSFFRGERDAISSDMENYQDDSTVGHSLDKPWKWLLDADQVIILDRDVASSFNLQSLESWTELTLPPSLPRADTKPLPPRDVGEQRSPGTYFLCFDNQYLAMSWASENPMEPPVFSIQPSPRAEAATRVSLNAAINRLSGSLARLLGPVGRKLMFIDRHNWVSSIEPAADHYARHFCIPSDWLSMNELLIEVTQLVVVFVRRNEIAVVRNWSATAEFVHLIEE